MDEKNASFQQQLEDALAARAQWCQTTQLPALGEAMRTFRSLFESVVEALIKKSLFREDPYERERPSDVLVPPHDTPIADTEAAAQAGMRITAYRRRLEYAATALPLTLESLTIARLKKLTAFFSYLDWSAFGEASRSPTTRVFARLVGQACAGADTLAARLVLEAPVRMGAIAKEIGARLAVVEALQRESWKARVRQIAPPGGQGPGYRTAADRAAELDAVKAACEPAQPALGWHPELVQEILAEDRGEESSGRRARLLASLVVPSVAAPAASAADSLRELHEAVKGLARLGADLRSVEEILLANEEAFRGRARGFLQRIRDWLRRAFGGVEERRYVVETRDSPEEEAKTETVGFLNFLTEMRDIGGMLDELGAVNGAMAARLSAMSRDQLCDFIDSRVRELRRVRRLMEGLNTLFQVRVGGRKESSGARSIKMELLAVENAVVRVDSVRQQSIVAAISQPTSAGPGAGSTAAPG